MIFLSRLRERTRVRAQSARTTLTFDPLPPEEGEEILEEFSARFGRE